MEKFITAAGCALRIDVREPKKEPEVRLPAVLLLHGYLESIEVWDNFAKQLSRRTRVISMDIPGHGISEVKGEIHEMSFLADVAAEAAAKTGTDKIVAIGHSMGGYVALEILSRHPKILEGLVLFHSTPNPDSEEKKVNRKREIEIVQGGKKELLAPHIAKCFAEENRRKFADVIADMTDQISLTDDEGIMALLRGMCDRKDNNETMQKSPVPQLMIFGRKDEYILPEGAESVIGKQPQASVAWLENSGHMGFIEEPERSLEIILDFMESVKKK